MGSGKDSVEKQALRQKEQLLLRISLSSPLMSPCLVLQNPDGERQTQGSSHKDPLSPSSIHDASLANTSSLKSLTAPKSQEPENRFRKDTLPCRTAPVHLLGFKFCVKFFLPLKSSLFTQSILHHGGLFCAVYWVSVLMEFRLCQSRDFVQLRTVLSVHGIISDCRMGGSQWSGCQGRQLPVLCPLLGTPSLSSVLCSPHSMLIAPLSSLTHLGDRIFLATHHLPPSVFGHSPLGHLFCFIRPCLLGFPLWVN